MNCATATVTAVRPAKPITTAFLSNTSALIISTTPKLIDPVSHRRTIPTAQLIGSSNPQHQAELMWRISLTVSVLLLCLLAVPLSYFNPRSGHTYNILIAIGFFWFTKTG